MSSQQRLRLGLARWPGGRPLSSVCSVPGTYQEMLRKCGCPPKQPAPATPAPSLLPSAMLREHSGLRTRVRQNRESPLVTRGKAHQNGPREGGSTHSRAPGDTVPAARPPSPVSQQKTQRQRHGGAPRISPDPHGQGTLRSGQAGRASPRGSAIRAPREAARESGSPQPLASPLPSADQQLLSSQGAAQLLTHTPLHSRWDSLSPPPWHHGESSLEGGGPCMDPSRLALSWFRGYEHSGAPPLGWQQAPHITPHIGQDAA